MVLKYFFGSRFLDAKKSGCFQSVFTFQAAPFANSGQVIRTIRHIAEFLVYDWCNFQSITFPMWFIILGCFFPVVYPLLPLMRFWSHTPQCPRFVTRPNTSPVVMLRSSSSVKPLVRDSGEAKRRSAKGTKTQSPGSEFFRIFFCGLEEGIGGALKLPPQNST